MKILISVDIEGIASVFHPEQTRAGNPEYERARRLMTLEANAVIEGAFAGGATEVLVNDSHGGFRNLLPDLLHPSASAILGKPRLLGMMSGVETGVDAVMMVGYHGRSQSSGILAHTINSFAFARVWLNDLELGEAGIYGALAGEFGVPVIFGSGDDIFVDEAKLLFPQANLISVKMAQGNTSGISISPQRAVTLLAEGAEAAMHTIKDAAPFVLQPQITCKLQTQSPALADCFCQLPILQRIDGVNVSFSAPSVQYAVRILNSLSAMSFMLRN
ncbi:M55 family metallopeptidase [Glaciimonas sp. CA11.2]|uniref:M55 family metallopeptidase n=1 Tax=unclassified Glaciimonas TaxID=2644401 RepID=UPI002AB59095|nr:MULTISPECIES: M55 family metallopeptidase [unclassified Glaciimonas]MDY7548804.1 M55 family metallopeptidase [Glaciimonas sp. CA11.2]MEB0012451.1 M55 family metallopeptidase [Glaciimonas sp. Cout2]MEB0082620.1 M55 family metallopeptidase [Glaciimonas sp. Gout2]MEB0164548.1 M55 family metallopeptidase [Glaciimonas sp. CA11.2]